MDYSPDEFTALRAAIERAGGAILPEKCEGTFAVFPVPNGTRTTRTKTCHCKNNSMVVLPYEPGEDDEECADMRERGAGFVRVCAVCDSVGRWPPFFAEIIEEED